MKHEGRGIIRLNKKTVHEGQVIAISSGTMVMSIEAALADDMTFCPDYKRKFSINPDSASTQHEGSPTRMTTISRLAARN